MPRKTDTLDRTIEFWRTRRTRKFLLTQKTIDRLRLSIKALDRQQFTLEHIQALNLAVSLFESQMRDCLRLAIDYHHAELDAKSEFLKIEINFPLIDHMRSRLLTLGEFFSINNNISNVNRLWNAISFCFPSFEEWCAKSFRGWCNKNRLPPYEFTELKSSVAWVYAERNRYVHEFFDETALTLGKPVSSTFVSRLAHSYDFLTYVQSLKEESFSYEFDENHPIRGEVGKEINQANKQIDELTAKFEDLLARHTNIEAADYVDSVRTSLSELLSTSKEYIAARSNFAYITYGPGGTIRNEIAAAETLAGLDALKSSLNEGLESVGGLLCGKPEDEA